MENNLEMILHNVLTCADLCLFAAGIVICIVQRSLSRWLWLVALGFMVFLLNGMMSMTATNLMRQPGANVGVLRYVFGAISIIYLVGWIIVVSGLGLALVDVSNQLKLWSEMSRREPPRTG